MTQTLVLIIALLPSLALAQPLPQPKAAGPGAAPAGYTASVIFCVLREGTQDAVPLLPNGSCPWRWTRSGSDCLRSGSGR